MKKYILLLCAFTLAIFIHAQTVYITKTGEKYHTGSCRHLSQSKIAIELKDALEQNYEPCKVCRPTQDITGNTIKNNGLDEKEDPEISPTQNNTTRNAESKQCTTTTQKGTRCKRMTTNANGKCWQHGGIEN